MENLKQIDNKENVEPETLAMEQNSSKTYTIEGKYI